jgi:hypothetical protein
MQYQLNIDEHHLASVLKKAKAAIDSYELYPTNAALRELFETIEECVSDVGSGEAYDVLFPDGVGAYSEDI